MELEQAERFVAAAEADYRMCVDDYAKVVSAGVELEEEVEVVRATRADVLAAQQVLALARREEEGARQAADWGHGGAQGMAKWKSGMAEMAREEGEERR